MNKKFIITIILFSFVFFSDCQRKQNNNLEKLVKKFPVKKELKGKMLGLSRKPLSLQDITVLDTFLILTKQKYTEESFFHVYHVEENYRYLGSFGKQGKAPSEFIEPSLTGQFVKCQNFSGAWIYDFQKLKLTLINITRTIQKEKTVIEKSISEPPVVGQARNLFILQNNMLTGTSMSPKGRFFFYNMDKKEIVKWIEYYPKVKDPPDKGQLHNFYSSKTCISPNGKKLISALTFFERIDIINTKTKSKDLSLIFNRKPKKPPETFLKDLSKPFPQNLEYYYNDLQVTNKYIYALKFNTIHKKLDVPWSTTPILQIFKLNGEPICSYRLNKGVVYFAVDERNKTVYGAQFTKNHEIKIIKYSISNNDINKEK